MSSETLMICELSKPREKKTNKLAYPIQEIDNSNALTDKNMSDKIFVYHPIFANFVQFLPHF